MIYKTCPDCGARVGEKHKDGCDVERCPHCGGQALGCVGFDPSDPRRQLGFIVGGDRSLPDINRPFAECRWDPELQQWELTHPQKDGGERIDRGGLEPGPHAIYEGSAQRTTPFVLQHRAGSGLV